MPPLSPFVKPMPHGTPFQGDRFSWGAFSVAMIALKSYPQGTPNRVGGIDHRRTGDYATGCRGITPPDIGGLRHPIWRFVCGFNSLPLGNTLNLFLNNSKRLPRVFFWHRVLEPKSYWGIFSGNWFWIEFNRFKMRTELQHVLQIHSA